MKSTVLKEILLLSIKEILSKNLSVDDSYNSIKRLFDLDELELNSLFSSIDFYNKRNKEQQIRDLAL